MRVWVIGAGRAGSSVLRQLRKNLDIEVVVSDPIEKPRAVLDGLIDKVDIVERITLLNVNEFAPSVLLMKNVTVSLSLVSIVPHEAYVSATT